MRLPASGMPVVETDLFSYDPDAGTIEKKYDLVGNAEHRVAALETDAEAEPGNWAGLGAASIFYEDGTYYVVCRERTCEKRGTGYQVWRNDGESLAKTDWEKVGETEEKLHVSVEKAALRPVGDRYYFYYTIDNGDDQWEVVYTVLDDLDDLISAFDSKAYTALDLPTSGKDPFVYDVGDDYYMHWNDRPDEDTHVIRADNPAFEGYTEVTANMTAPYEAAQGVQNNSKPHAPVYDPDSETFVYWGHSRVDDALTEWWLVSEDLEEWEFVEEREIEPKTTPGRYFQYLEYLVHDDGTGVVVSEMDQDDDGENQLFVWELPEFN